jgi:eukaryotic-like serine/threonine-protein kinase
MSPQEWLHIDELFEAALKLKAEERPGFLRSACCNNKALYEELESLLAFDERASSFLESPAAAVASGSTEGSDSSALSRRLGSGLHVGAYEIVSYLGGGGMGQLYRARDTRLGRDVALKFLAGETAAGARALERFQREARAASALNHPNICTLHDIGEYEGRPFLVMELLDGQSVKERLAQGPLVVQEVVEFGIQIAQALEALHSEGIVHRDVKPANVFVTRHGRAKLLDLGLAKAVVDAHINAEPETGVPDSKAAADVTLTSYGTAIGTAAFMAPEQVRGEPVDPRADLFSLGVTLYQMATGRLPFSGSNIESTMEAILHTPPVRPRSLNPSIPAQLEGVILKALERDRASRYSSAAELRADLERLRRTAQPAGKRRIALVATTLALALVVILSAAAWLGWFGELRQPELVARQFSANPLDHLVMRAPMSPDGAYLAYTDHGGIHVRGIETGETWLIPAPKDYCFT